MQGICKYKLNPIGKRKKLEPQKINNDILFENNNSYNMIDGYINELSIDNEIQPKTLEEINKILEWNNSKDELICTLKVNSRYTIRVLTQEIENLLNMTPNDIKREVSILEKYAFANIDDDFDGN